jgi:hypothetical protein
MSDVHLALLTKARKVLNRYIGDGENCDGKDLEEVRGTLERYLFEGETCRDDVAEICQQIDDVLPSSSTPASGLAQERASA